MLPSLDDLASDWLAPDDEEHFALPAIVNFVGMVQAAFDVTGIQHWTCPPTAMSTATALLYERRGERPVRVRGRVEFRWKAYEIERRAAGVVSTTRMPSGRFGVMQEIRFERSGMFHLVFRGLPRSWRFAEYWNVPPEDVPQRNVRCDARGFVLDDVKTFARAEIRVPSELAVHDDLQAWLDGEAPLERGRVGVATLRVSAGDVVRWWGMQGCETEVGELDFERDWSSGRDAWNETWRAAFTPRNVHFSGQLPLVTGSLSRLYFMSVLTLLMCRRTLPKPTQRALVATGGQCIWNSGDRRPLERAYVWGGPEGAPTTLFLWELEFQAPLLARLEPDVLRNLLEAMLHVDLRRHWGIETLTGAGVGMGYGVNAGAILSCVADYVRITGDRAWALERIDTLRGSCRPELTDYGACENILECVPSYEGIVASFNALQVKGLRFVASLTHDTALARAADALAKQVLTLYEDGPFACIRGGERRVVRTILDFAYVGLSMTDDLPRGVKDGMVAFFERELMTRDWVHALSPRDPDALSTALPAFQTFRADHQATGSYDGWVPRAAAVLARFGHREKALRWLEAIQELTREGPFGQAHRIVGGRTRKASFFNGNVYFESAGCGFATTILDELRLE